MAFTPLLTMQTPGETALALAAKLKQLRLLKALTRETLASRAGVTAASLKRFENTGAASLELVLKVAFALNRLADFSGVLEPPPATSIAELEARFTRPVRKRGRL